MKTVSLETIKSNEINLTDISTIKQTNLWSNLIHHQGRTFNGFLLLLKGECVFRCDGEEIKLSQGGLIYLPKGAKHSAYAKERSLEFYRVNFTARENISGEEIIFSEVPKCITELAPKYIIDLCEQMRLSCMIEGSGFKSLSQLCSLIDFSIKLSPNKYPRRISSAIEHINEHYTEQISISDLAELSFISEPHLFRIFKKELGVSPIEYKNELRIKRAEALLSDPECSIGEIALLLGFENACYFSRIFKKFRGISPKKYREIVLGDGFH